MTGDNVLVEVAEASDGGLGLVANDGKDALVALLGLGIGVDVDDDDVGEVTHTLLGDTKQLGSVLAELDALHGSGELPGLEVLARLDIPKAHGVVGGTGGDHGAGGVDVDSPDGTNVAVVSAETLAIVRVPNANLLILGDGEDEVTVIVVSVFAGSATWLAAVNAAPLCREE